MKRKVAYKLKSVACHNRRRTIDVEYTSGKCVTVHYGQLGISQKIETAWVDKETHGRSIGMRFSDGTDTYMPYDQPLALAKDPEYLLQSHIERLVALVRHALAVKHISKRYLATQLGTSDNQIQRLLDPAILNKNLEQLYHVGSLVGLAFEWRVVDAA